MKKSKSSSYSVPFDGVSRDPIDQLAASMFYKGVKPPRINMRDMQHWETCPPIYTNKIVKKICRASGDDLTGMRRGRMVVVGLSSNIKARWIMRCDCGDYEPRTAKSIKNKNNSDDCCRVCRKTDYSKQRHHYHITGKDL